MLLESLTYLELNSVSFGVHSDLELHVVNKGLQDAVPVLTQRCVPMSGHWDLPVLILLALSEITDLDLVEFNLV